MLTVKRHGDPEIVQAVKDNQLTAHKVYQETQTKRKEAKQKESKSDSGPEDAQIQANVAEDKSEPEENAGPQQQVATATDTDDDENDDEINPGESGQIGDKGPEDEYGFVAVKISLAQYEALSEYEGAVEEMLEEAIDRYLEYLEQEEGSARAEDETSWEKDDDDEDVEAA